MKKTIKINRWLLFSLCILYSVVSFVAIMFIYLGWAAYIYIAIPLLLLYLVSLVTLLIHAMIGQFKGNYHSYLDRKYLLIVVCLQTAVILFGGGDCGDGPGVHSALQYIFSSNSICTANSSEFYLSIIQLGYLFIFAYVVSVIAILIKTVLTKTE